MSAVHPRDATVAPRATLTFEALQRAGSVAGLTPAQRLRLFWGLPEELRQQVWASLEEPGR